MAPSTGGSVGFMPDSTCAQHEHLGIFGQVDDGIDIRRRPNVRHAPQDRMILESFVNHPAGALFAVAAVMINPRLAEHLLSKPARPILVVPVVFGIRALLVLFVLERVSAGAQRDDRFAGVDVIHEMFHLLIRQLAEAQAHHAQISGIQRFQAGDVGQCQRINRAVGRVDGEQHGAFESVPRRKNLRQHRQRFFGAILLVPGEKDDVLALARPVLRPEQPNRPPAPAQPEPAATTTMLNNRWLSSLVTFLYLASHTTRPSMIVSRTRALSMSAGESGKDCGPA